MRAIAPVLFLLAVSCVCGEEPKSQSAPKKFQLETRVLFGNPEGNEADGSIRTVATKTYETEFDKPVTVDMSMKIAVGEETYGEDRSYRIEAKSYPEGKVLLQIAQTVKSGPVKVPQGLTPFIAESQMQMSALVNFDAAFNTGKVSMSPKGNPNHTWIEVKLKELK